MIKGVEGGRKVEKNKSGDLLLVACEGNVIVDAEECSFQWNGGDGKRTEGE